MNTRQTLYRSTLVAAALAVGTLGVATAASAHEHDRDGRDFDRPAYRAPYGWHGRGPHRGFEAYRPAPEWRPAYREDGGYRADDRDAARWLPRPAYRVAPGADIVYGGRDVSVAIHVPL
jgi:hypothetical protein